MLRLEGAAANTTKFMMSPAADTPMLEKNVTNGLVPWLYAVFGSKNANGISGPTQNTAIPKTIELMVFGMTFAGPGGFGRCGARQFDCGIGEEGPQTMTVNVELNEYLRVVSSVLE